MAEHSPHTPRKLHVAIDLASTTQQPPPTDEFGVARKKCQTGAKPSFNEINLPWRRNAKRLHPGVTFANDYGLHKRPCQPRWGDSPKMNATSEINHPSCVCTRCKSRHKASSSSRPRVPSSILHPRIRASCSGEWDGQESKGGRRH